MEEKNIWNKTTAEVTVKDQLILSAVITTAVIAVPVAVGGILSAAKAVKSKVQDARSKQNDEPVLVES